MVGKKINYYCPEFLRSKNIYRKLFYYKENYPEIFYDDVNLKAIFGSFRNMLWNGGAVFTGEKNFLPEVIETRDFYRELNIPLQLTLTNSQITKNNLNDIYCNDILKIMENDLNEVMVSTDLMYNYIKNNYPKYKINRSIVNTPNDYNWELALDEKYDKIVMPRRHVKDLKYLANINKQYRNRIEILCNDRCPLDCPMIYSHYKLFEELTINGGPDKKSALKCQNEKINNSLFNRDFSSQITYTDIINNYIPLGYTEFKLSGRGNIYNMIMSLTLYFIKPEFQIYFYNDLIQNIS